MKPLWIGASPEFTANVRYRADGSPIAKRATKFQRRIARKMVFDQVRRPIEQKLKAMRQDELYVRNMTKHGRQAKRVLADERKFQKKRREEEKRQLLLLKMRQQQEASSAAGPSRPPSPSPTSSTSTEP